MLEVCKLDFDYQDQTLFHNVSFHLPVGGVLHLKGDNGTGKTTLLKLIAGLHAPNSGTILFKGQSIHTNLTVYQNNICFVGHKPGINPYLTVRENCTFDLHYHNENLNDLAKTFKLENHLDQPCALLSAGQRRRVALLRLWMSNAPLWLLDEPLVALDDFAMRLIMEQIEIHRAQGGAVLLTSHQSLPLAKSTYQEYLL